MNNSACEVLTRCALQNLLGPEQTASASHSLKAASTTVLNDQSVQSWDPKRKRAQRLLCCSSVTCFCQVPISEVLSEKI